MEGLRFQSATSIAGRCLLTASALAGLIATAVMVPAGSFAQTTAACAVATPGQSTPAVADASPAIQSAIPTEAAIAPEQNPPGDIPDNQAFVVYSSAAGGYNISVPEGWARAESGPNVAFSDKLHRVAVDISCAGSAPTVESARTEASGPLAQTIPAFALVDVKEVSLSSGPAILVQYQANSVPDDVTGKQIRLDVDRYEIYHNGTLAVVTLSSPAGSDNVDVSNQISGSFQCAS